VSLTTYALSMPSVYLTLNPHQVAVLAQVEPSQNLSGKNW